MNATPDPLTADAQTEVFDSWALVEIFGHDKNAGHVTSRKFGTEIMFQVDVPNADGPGFAYSRLINPKAVFSIQPTNESWRRRWVIAAQQYHREVLPCIPEFKQIGAGGVGVVDDDEEF